MTVGSDWTCSGFDLIEHPEARVLARSESVPWVRFVLEDGESLYDAASRDNRAFQMEGRSPVFVIPEKIPGRTKGGPTKRWAVRHYTRGGRFIPLVLGDRYLRTGQVRPYLETQASERARTRKIPTPRIIAAAMYPAGIFYRADLVTEYIPDATDLVEALFDTSRKGVGGASERLDALNAAGGLLRQMAAKGVLHPDIHGRNILLRWKGAAPTAHLLDLDRCQIGPEGVGFSPASMLQRLRRSLRKWEKQTGIRISEREWQTLDRAVGG